MIARNSTPHSCETTGRTCRRAMLAALSSCLPALLVSAAPPEWRPEVFDYDQPTRLEVAEKGEPKDKMFETRQQELTFKNLRDEQVPVLITLPGKGKGPFPAVILVHPLGGDRGQMTREMGKALTDKGFACAALDLPKHGNRMEAKGKGEDLFDPDDPDRTYKNIVGAVMDIRQTIDLLKQRRDLDVDKGVPIVGYSMGAWFATLAGSADRRVPMLVLLCAGANTDPAGNSKGLLEGPSGGQRLFQQFPSICPETAIAEFARPLLMQNGKKDPFIPEENARQFYRRAKAPKELKWYDGGHILPQKTPSDAAEWIAKNR